MKYYVCNEISHISRFCPLIKNFIDSKRKDNERKDKEREKDETGTSLAGPQVFISSITTEEDKDIEFIIDSGSSQHMIPDIKVFINLKKDNIKRLTASDVFVKSEECRDIVILLEK